ncbi:TrmH family RNA methyltransferase [Salimicrobium halophilum]|uniref:RNA methyltransferase, TrmH family n=1 Tax=Salimicrobium halophilum TaxID=86666 RepID=A0A1G8VG72_9BACI|nr:RNA methyltransferase [Salimicrobium halophilum]SDJ65053.1 RNA methyltransferase, TrmH family [Salimicrobium halophilum]
MITSVKNQKVKEWKKLHKKKYRDQAGTFLVEGHHLVEEVLTSDWNIRELILLEDKEAPSSYHGQKEWVNDQVMKEISQTETPQGIVAVVDKKERVWEEGTRLLLLDTIQDPGNLGTLIRTADAAGFDAVLVGKGSVDLFNDKVLRATQGSIFHDMKVVEVSLEEEMSRLKDAGFSIWGTALEGAKIYKELEVPERVALLVGNEGNGVQETLLAEATEKVSIPMYGKAESLNVAVAAGILMYALKE